MSILQTPYRALNDAKETPTIPSWATKRAVYRGGHETYYVAETNSVDSARGDIDTLEQLGWIVEVHPLALDGSARITMHYPAESRVA